MRLELGAYLYSSLGEANLNAEEIKALSMQRDQNTIAKRLIFFLENLNHRWNYFLLRFDIDKQKDLLEQLDINIGLAILLGMFVTLILSLLLSWLFRNRERIPRSTRIFNLINQTLNQYNLETFPNEGPLAWQQRISEALPGKREQIKELFACYLAEAYANQSNKENLKRAKKLIQKL